MYFYLSANTAKDMGITDFASTSGDHDELSRHWYLGAPQKTENKAR